MRAASGAGVGRQTKRETVISIRSRHCSQSRTYVHFLSDLYLQVWFASTYLNIKICLKVLLVFLLGKTVSEIFHVILCTVWIPDIYFDGLKTKLVGLPNTL